MDPDDVAGDQKKARNEGRTIAFLDESGFYLAPLASYSWGPCGHALRVRGKLRSKHLSVIGALTEHGRLFLQAHRHTCHSHEVIVFLRHLLCKIPGPLLILWDGGRIHRSRELAAFVAQDRTGRLAFEPFPPYAPDVDPQEYVWRHLKYDDVVNRTKFTIDQLEIYLREAAQRLRRRVSVLQNFIRHVGLDV
jgi:transposase